MRSTCPRSTEGFTVFEVLVACTLTVVAFGLVMAFLVPSLRAQTRGAARAELEQGAALALTTLERDLKSSAGPGISLAATPLTLTIHPLETLVGSDQQWSPHLWVYLWNRQTGVLSRGRWPEQGPALSLAVPLPRVRPIRVGPADLGLLASQPAPGYQVVAREVVDCQVTHAGGSSPSVTSPLQLRLRLQREVGPGQVQTFEMERAVALRNHL